MSFRKWAVVSACLLLCVAPSYASKVTDQAPEEKPKAEPERITVEELKAKIAKREPVVIIDLRSSKAYSGSDTKIKGSMFIRFRRLKHKMTQSPLKDVPRDRDVVTYCACPNDESAVHAAEVLSAGGFKRVRVLKGGWTAWQAGGGQVEQKPKS